MQEAQLGNMEKGKSWTRTRAGADALAVGRGGQEEDARGVPGQRRDRRQQRVPPHLDRVGGIPCDAQPPWVTSQGLNHPLSLKQTI